jgi:hypothetical protein
MKTIKVNGLGTDVPKGSAFAIETSKFLPKLHQLSLYVGKRGSGKSVSMYNTILKFKEDNKCDRVLVISPTYNSNKQLFKKLDIQDEDVFDDVNDPELVSKIKDIVNAERDEYLEYHQKLKMYNYFVKKLSSKNAYIDDDELLMFFNGQGFEKPTHKYNGRRPVIHLIVDDCQGSKLFMSRAFQNLIISHRHQGAFKDGGAIGISVYCCVQNYRATGGGCPRYLRNNATTLFIFKSKDTAELKDIQDECGGEVDEPTFYKVYNEAIKEPHDCLLIDLHPKEEYMRFRRNLDTFIIPQSE